MIQLQANCTLPGHTTLTELVLYHVKQQHTVQLTCLPTHPPTRLPTHQSLLLLLWVIVPCVETNDRYDVRKTLGLHPLYPW